MILCRCPACYPEKWALGNMIQTALTNPPMSQTGIPASGPQSETMAEVLTRLKRIEAILEAHIGNFPQVAK